MIVAFVLLLNSNILSFGKIKGLSFDFPQPNNQPEIKRENE